MIETERQRQAAVSWIQYWKASISAGEQSWLGQEQAQETIMALHKQVDAYDMRVRASSFDPTQTLITGAVPLLPRMSANSSPTSIEKGMEA